MNRINKLKDPLVSVIVATKNSAEFIDKCLKSIKNQAYKKVEIIVVDNNSIDKTKDIAKKYTGNVFNKGPERSAQRNFGASKAKGKYLLFIDSDMILTKNVVKECVKKYETSKSKKIGGIIVPEISFGHGFWASCKALEKKFYFGVDWIEAPRFYLKKVFKKVSGYDENLISGEDWDLSNRIKAIGKTGRVNVYIYHNEGNLSYVKLMKKKFYYSSTFKNYIKKDKNKSVFSIVFNRFKLFFSEPIKLFKNPIVGLGMLFMVFSEFTFGGIGYIMKNFQITRQGQK
jgi:glycosyltransferase involved in cell wall biosynthesis